MAQAHGEVTRLALHVQHFAVRQQSDIGVPPGLDQLGRDSAHGAVVGGEGLVELGHDAADADVLFHQIHLQAGIGQIEGSLNPCDAGTDNHHRTDFFIVIDHERHLKRWVYAGLYIL